MTAREAHPGILVVEDSKFQRHTLTRQLQEWGYDVMEASDGVSGLNLFEQHSPNLVITDLNMPNMDGFQLVRAIRDNEVHYTYILVISGLKDKESIVAAIAAGADDYIVKPFYSGELEVRLNSAERILRLQSQDMLIFAMAQLADYRSRETGNHLKRVQHFSRILAEDLGKNDYSELNKARATVIESLSCLHDIGKVAIPDSILNKPGKLTKLEFSIMKEHSHIGGRLIEDVYHKTGSEHLGVAKDIVMHHHEKWDGTGYPDGIKGLDIPLAARIVALADVFDALATERCYKPAFSKEQCRSIILKEEGRHFDPSIVAAHFRNEKKFYEILVNLKD